MAASLSTVGVGGLGYKIAVVTGGNRGIGFEICKKLLILGGGGGGGVHLFVGCRNEDYGKEAVGMLEEELKKGSGGSTVQYVLLDVADEKSIEKGIAGILEKHRRIDILVNNAGMLENGDDTIMQVSSADVVKHINSNALGPLKAIQLVLPSMLTHNYGRIVNVTSISGSIDNLLNAQKYRAFPETAYRISKGTLNWITALFEDYIRPDGLRPGSANAPRPNILINSVCPGFAKTRMGGPTADITAEKAAEMPYKLATSPDDGPTGKFFRGAEELGW